MATTQSNDSNITEKTRETLKNEVNIACDHQCDIEEMLDGVARAMLKNFADSVFVDLIQDDGSMERILTRHTNLRKERVLEEHRKNYPLPPTSSYGYPRVIKTGKPQFIPGVTPRLADRLFPKLVTEGITDPVAVRSYICVPLIAHDRTLGALSAMITDRKHSFATEDLVLLEQMAAKIAEVMDSR